MLSAKENGMSAMKHNEREGTASTYLQGSGSQCTSSKGLERKRVSMQGEHTERGKCKRGMKRMYARVLASACW
jgi:hypothetical protein